MVLMQRAGPRGQGQFFSLVDECGTRVVAGTGNEWHEWTDNLSLQAVRSARLFWEALEIVQGGSTGTGAHSAPCLQGGRLQSPDPCDMGEGGWGHSDGSGPGLIPVLQPSVRS